MEPSLLIDFIRLSTINGREMQRYNLGQIPLGRGKYGEVQDLRRIVSPLKNCMLEKAIANTLMYSVPS